MCTQFSDLLKWMILQYLRGTVANLRDMKIHLSQSDWKHGRNGIYHSTVNIITDKSTENYSPRLRLQCEGTHHNWDYSVRELTTTETTVWGNSPRLRLQCEGKVFVAWVGTYCEHRVDCFADIQSSRFFSTITILWTNKLQTCGILNINLLILEWVGKLIYKLTKVSSVRVIMW